MLACSRLDFLLMYCVLGKWVTKPMGKCVCVYVWVYRCWVGIWRTDFLCLVFVTSILTAQRPDWFQILKTSERRHFDKIKWNLKLEIACCFAYFRLAGLILLERQLVRLILLQAECLVQILSLPYTSCVTLGKLHNLSASLSLPVKWGW